MSLMQSPSTPSTAREGEAQASLALLQANWRWLVLRAGLALAFGLIALFSPLAAVYALTFVFGAYALLDGILSIVMAVRRTGEQNGTPWWLLVLRGTLGVFTGLAVVLVPWVAALALVTFNWVMLALWAIFAGVMEVATGRRLRREMAQGGLLMMISGILSVLLGLAVPVLLVFDPSAGMLAMGWMMGVYALLAGALLMILALKLRKAQAAAETKAT